MIALASMFGSVESTRSSTRIGAGSSVSCNIPGPTFGRKFSFADSSSIRFSNATASSSDRPAISSPTGCVVIRMLSTW